MDKHRVINALIAAVEADLEAVTASQRSTQEGAVHDEARAEDDKDTRAIESQYLARGLAQRVEDLREMHAMLTAMEVRSFTADDPIRVSALVTVEDDDGKSSVYLVAPAGGGRKIVDEGETVLVATPKAPLGRALLNKRCGDEVTIKSPKGERVCEIVEVV